MRATLIADYSHTLVLYCILISFALIAYGSSSLIGSPAKMWELLHQASQEHPVSGNAQGSYLTMRSKSGLIFGVLNIVGNFVSSILVISDQSLTLAGNCLQRSGLLATSCGLSSRD